jgi:hypothetical protein
MQLNSNQSFSCGEETKGNVLFTAMSFAITPKDKKNSNSGHFYPHFLAVPFASSKSRGGDGGSLV